MKHPNITKELLEKLYSTDLLSGRNIAKQLNVNFKTVYRYLKFYKISIKYNRNMQGKNNPFFGKNHSRQVIKESRERNIGKMYYTETLTKDVLIDLYEKQEIKAENIAKQFNVDIKTIWRYLRKYNIHVKRTGNYFKGDKNPAWIDGRSYLPYSSEFSDILKLKIRTRDNFECQNCGITEEENLIIKGRNLDVHHIDYIKEHCDEHNLITLCRQCNIRANLDRDYWQQFYKDKIASIYINCK